MSNTGKDTFKQSYDHIVAAGDMANQPPEPMKKRGRPKQGKVRNILRLLSEHKIVRFFQRTV